jgi:hypothetical protein
VTFSIEERLVKAAAPSSGQNRREIFIRALFTHESRKGVLLVGSNMVFRQVSHSRVRADVFTPASSLNFRFPLFARRTTSACERRQPAFRSGDHSANATRYASSISAIS